MPLTSAQLATVTRTRVELASGLARKRREAAGVGLGELADAIEVSHQAVSAWERGLRRPGAASALAYGLTLAKLTRAAAA